MFTTSQSTGIAGTIKGWQGSAREYYYSPVLPKRKQEERRESLRHREEERKRGEKLIIGKFQE